MLKKGVSIILRIYTLIILIVTQFVLLGTQETSVYFTGNYEIKALFIALISFPVVYYLLYLSRLKKDEDKILFIKGFAIFLPYILAFLPIIFFFQMVSYVGVPQALKDSEVVPVLWLTLLSSVHIARLSEVFDEVQILQVMVLMVYILYFLWLLTGEVTAFIRFGFYLIITILSSVSLLKISKVNK